METSIQKNTGKYKSEVLDSGSRVIKRSQVLPARRKLSEVAKENEEKHLQSIKNKFINSNIMDRVIRAKDSSTNDLNWILEAQPELKNVINVITDDHYQIIKAISTLVDIECEIIGLLSSVESTSSNDDYVWKSHLNMVRGLREHSVNNILDKINDSKNEKSIKTEDLEKESFEGVDDGELVSKSIIDIRKMISDFEKNY